MTRSKRRQAMFRASGAALRLTGHCPVATTGGPFCQPRTDIAPVAHGAARLRDADVVARGLVVGTDAIHRNVRAVIFAEPAAGAVTVHAACAALLFRWAVVMRRVGAEADFVYAMAVGQPGGGVRGAVGLRAAPSTGRAVGADHRALRWTGAGALLALRAQGRAIPVGTALIAGNAPAPTRLLPARAATRWR
jgi:hypothetical protein